MNFRSCKYFIAVYQAGTIKDAAEKLRVSPQSLGEHMRKLEKDLGVRLFYRNSPLTLTDAGKEFLRAAEEIVKTLGRLESKLDAIKGYSRDTLVIGCMDYGTPVFIPALTELFLTRVPNVSIQTREISSTVPVPDDVALVISARELSGFQSEILFYDSLVVCVSDRLLKKTYGEEWTIRRDRLAEGDLSAIAECPFIQHRNTPLAGLMQLAFESNHFAPDYLPVQGSTDGLMRYCMDGQGAIVTLTEVIRHIPGFPPAYRMPNVPDKIPTGFICYKPDIPLSHPAQKFLEITRRFFSRKQIDDSVFEDAGLNMPMPVLHAMAPDKNE